MWPTVADMDGMHCQHGWTWLVYGIATAIGAGTVRCTECVEHNKVPLSRLTSAICALSAPLLHGQQLSEGDMLCVKKGETVGLWSTTSATDHLLVDCAQANCCYYTVLTTHTSLSALYRSSVFPHFTLRHLFARIRVRGCRCLLSCPLVFLVIFSLQPAAMSSKKEPRNLPTTSYPTWLMTFVAPAEMEERRKDLSQPPPPTTVQPASIEPSTIATAQTQAPLHSHNNPTMLTILPPTTHKPTTTTHRPPPQQRYRTRAEQDEHDGENIVKFARRLFAEFLGTFIFVFLVAGVALEFNLTNSQADGLRGGAALNQTGCGLASGLVLTILIYALGQISGAHFNPCVTWAFTLRGLFPAVWVIPYWIAQFGGCILAGGFLQAFYWHNAHYATTNVNPHYQWVTGFAYEALLTFFLITVILSVATRAGNVGAHAALADGFTLAVLVCIGLSYTGTAANPWRALGPGIVNGQRDNLWVYVAGPFLGATVAVLSTWGLMGPVKDEEAVGAAQGAGEAQPDDDED